MSPEQARGKPVDKRSDVWAFGCILYEMLTGTPVFTGESTTDILADVVKKDPDWARLPASLPDRLVELMARCLQKNPKDRLRDIGDARYELEFSTSRAPSEARRSPLASLMWLAAGAAIGAVIMLVLPVGRRPAVETQVPNRVSIDLPPDMTISLGRGSSVILSPDGRTLAFVGRTQGRTQLYLRALDKFESRAIDGTDDASNPFFSPDGRWIGFFAGTKVKKVSLDGGAPVTVGDVPNARGEAWGPDDAIYVTPSNTASISKIPARGGKLEPVTELQKGQLSHRWPRLLPDGTGMLFSIWNDNGFESSRIVAQRFGSQEQIPVIDVGGGYPRYVRDGNRKGYLVYARTEGMLAVPFDETTLSASGQAVPLSEGVVTNLSGGAHFDVSANGTLAYLPGSAAEDERELSWVTIDGKPTPSRKIRGLTRTWKLSQDGRRVARNNGGGPSDIWVEDLVSGTTTRITSAPDAYNFNPVWMPDSKTVIYGHGLFGSGISRRSADGTGPEEVLIAASDGSTSNSRQSSPFSVSSDGKWLSYYLIDPATSLDIWMLPLPAGGKPADPGAARPFVKTPGTDGSAVFSADDKWVAYQSNESGRFEVYLRSFPDGGQTLRVSTEGGVSPVFSPTGDEIYYRSLDGKIKAVPMSAAPAFQEKVRVLFDASKYDNNFAVAPDGRLLMMPLMPAELYASRINVVFNLLTELRQRVK
jgi:serine/threonine-protein kinase